MIRSISQKVACILSESIDNGDKNYEVYEYAVFIVLSELMHLVTVIILGLIFNLLFESMVFYGTFIIIRKFAGGYHAKTPLRCYIFSVATSVASLVMIKLLLMQSNETIPLILLALELLSIAIISFLAPIDNENKPLNDREKKVYKVVSILASVVMLIGSIILVYFNLLSIAIPIAFGVFMCAVVLIMRKVQIVKNKTKQ